MSEAHFRSERLVREPNLIWFKTGFTFSHEEIVPSLKSPAANKTMTVSEASA